MITDIDMHLLPIQYQVELFNYIDYFITTRSSKY